MPTTLETLRTYRAAHADGPPSARVWLFHSHAYFDHASPERVEEARAFMKRVEDAFSRTRHVEVHSFMAAPVGPHPRGNFEVLFTREAFADYVMWLAFERPPAIDVLIHALTRSLALDHGSRAIWLGKPVAVDVAMLEAIDAKLAAAGRSEESIIDGSKKH